MKSVKAVLADYEEKGKPLAGLKADFLAERSIPDNISLEASQNTFIVAISYAAMFLYVGCAIGHLPSTVHSKFSLGAAGIFVVGAALLSAMGITFYMD